MKTNEQIKAGIKSYLQDCPELIKISDFLDCYAENAAEERLVGEILKEMAREDEVRLVSVAILADVDSDELARCLAALNCDQNFYFVEE